MTSSKETPEYIEEYLEEHILATRTDNIEYVKQKIGRSQRTIDMHIAKMKEAGTIIKLGNIDKKAYYCLAKYEKEATRRFEDKKDAQYYTKQWKKQKKARLAYLSKMFPASLPDDIAEEIVLKGFEELQKRHLDQYSIKYTFPIVVILQCSETAQNLVAMYQSRDYKKIVQKLLLKHGLTDQFTVIIAYFFKE
jgi:hypothetical protein